MFASTSYALKEKQAAAVVAKALDLRRDVLSTDFSGSLRAGTSAIEAAYNAVAAGTAKNVLVVASDCRMGAPRGALESAAGAADRDACRLRGLPAARSDVARGSASPS